MVWVSLPGSARVSARCWTGGGSFGFGVVMLVGWSVLSILEVVVRVYVDWSGWVRARVWRGSGVGPLSREALWEDLAVWLGVGDWRSVDRMELASALRAVTRETGAVVRRHRVDGRRAPFYYGVVLADERPVPPGPGVGSDRVTTLPDGWVDERVEVTGVFVDSVAAEVLRDDYRGWLVERGALVTRGNVALGLRVLSRRGARVRRVRLGGGRRDTVYHGVRLRG